jgi:glycosyltransferase involved in cell wall biosynthesis
MAHKFVVVIPSYNNESFCEKNLLSALTQDYGNFRILFTDDRSSDNTFAVARSVSKQYPNIRSTLIKNRRRCGAMANFYTMISSCAKDEIVVVLDGDDWLAHPNVLKRLAQEYDKGVWTTYGQYQSSSNGDIGPSKTIPDEVIEKNSFRRYQWCSSHLRTFYAGLFQKINIQDFKVFGKFLPMTCDLAMMFPILEMSGKNQAYIDDILYIYNDDTPLNDYKVNRDMQINLEKYIRSKVPYAPIANF